MAQTSKSDIKTEASSISCSIKLLNQLLNKLEMHASVVTS